jgi:hypothetical protein
VLDKQWTDVMNFGRFYPHRPEHSLEGKLDDLLGLADHLGVGPVVSQHGGAKSILVTGRSSRFSRSPSRS